MALLLSRGLLAIGLVLLGHSAYSTYQFRKDLKLTDTPYTHIPLDIVIETVISLVICLVAAGLLAGRLRPIKLTSIAAAKSWDTINQRPSFITVERKPERAETELRALWKAFTSSLSKVVTHSVSSSLHRSYVMSRELISPEGLRIDGRRPNEIRNINCEMGIFEQADGSAYYEQGNTRVLCAVYGPREVSLRSTARVDRAIVNCEYSMATFSTGERKKRTKGDRRSAEISLIIKQTFETAIFTELFPNSQIDIYIQVIQADGGTRCAGINAATLAIIDAGIPMSDFVVACAAGYVSETPILDLNHYEDSSGAADLPIAIFPRSDKVLMAQMDSKVPLQTFEKVIRVAMDGCHKIFEKLEKCVRERSEDLLVSRGVL